MWSEERGCLPGKGGRRRDSNDTSSSDTKLGVLKQGRRYMTERQRHEDGRVMKETAERCYSLERRIAEGGGRREKYSTVRYVLRSVSIGAPDRVPLLCRCGSVL